MPRHPWKPELWKLQLEPWELNLSELPDGGASILDLPDGDALAPLLVNIHPYPGGTAYPSVIMGSTGAGNPEYIGHAPKSLCELRL